ncbi:hypothetical protein ACWE42_13540 [Sutcliffiella cohnii]|uniref:Uncharacterized protein n=1 Tax=Sutcliffiella cohnii TaxID=33932 RepID=A0A223KPZ9_9BACI|nr:hypothetical protein [Sutcliffiella cohnii]AST91447.1 hypothetical protein BC6307_09215 [Sutcliffiella cohnii]MED4014994.1 hypothetical protein [Sutcliffiella cohnii]
MSNFFHILFAAVLLFNIFSCQSITKVIKTEENIEDPILSTPLTTPIFPEYSLQNKPEIHSIDEMKQYLIQQYNLPEKWDKKIKSIKTRFSKNDQVIAVVLEDCDSSKKDKESDKVFYLKNTKGTFLPLQEQLVTGSGMYFSVPKTPLTTVKKMRNSVSKKEDVDFMNKTDEKMKEAIVQQKKAEKVVEHLPKDVVTEEKTEEILQKSAKENIEKIHVVENIKAEAFQNHLHDIFMHATTGTMIILHMSYPGSKSSKKIKIKIPEFKSRGFRFIRPSKPVMLLSFFRKL